jgi:hypothetical protein
MQSFLMFMNLLKKGGAQPLYMAVARIGRLLVSGRRAGPSANSREENQ